MIHLYAEHLLNIQTLSINASLSTVSNRETKAKLSADGSILTLTHEGETASVKLPINLSPNKQSNVTLTIPAIPSRELTFRVQLEAREGVSNGVLNNGASSENGNVVPWTADSLCHEAEICCKSCGAVLVKRGKVRDWRDLPSEGWAEMMDFWHCHKPDESHVHDHSSSKKGYAANSQLALKQGIAMVDATDFLFASADCEGIAISNAYNPAALLCRTCEVPVGYIEVSTQGYKLRKHRLSLSPSVEHPPITFADEKWFACLLLDAMDNQGVRKFIMNETDSDSSRTFKLWIFTPDLSISSSVRPSPDPVRVIKVLWQEIDSPANTGDTLRGSSSMEGELTLYDGEATLLRSKLQESREMLPECARNFQEWHVGLLERFTLGDIDGLT